MRPKETVPVDFSYGGFATLWAVFQVLCGDYRLVVVGNFARAAHQLGS